MQAVVLAFVVMIAATEIGRIVQELISSSDGFGWRGYATASERRIQDIALLGFGIVLVSAAPRRSGISLGTLRNAPKAVVACLVVFGVSAAFRYLPFDFPASIEPTRSRLFRGCWGTTSWLVSPLAQELIFSGFVFGSLDRHFPRRWHRILPITTAGLLTALLFGLWHLIPDYLAGHNSGGFVAFRFVYTAAGMLIYTMTRVWTGSIIYALLTHTAVNFMFLVGFSCAVSGF